MGGESLARARGLFKKEIEREEAMVKQIESSEGAQAAAKIREKQVIIRIHNVTHNTKPKELVDILVQTLVNARFTDGSESTGEMDTDQSPESMDEKIQHASSSAILRCEILQKDGRSSERATVFLSSKRAFDALMSQPAIDLKGRMLKIKEDKNQKRTRDSGCYRFEKVTMRIAKSVDHAIAQDYFWQSNSIVTVTLNPLDAKMRVDIGEFRMEIPFRRFRAVHVAPQPQTSNTLLHIQLSHPPIFFRRMRDSLDDIFNIFSKHNQTEKKESRDKLFADTQPDEKDNPWIWDIDFDRDAKFERCISPSKHTHFEFAHCLSYMFVINEHMLLKNVLSVCSLNPEEITQPLRFKKIDIKFSEMDWTGGYDKLFSNLPFSVSYYIHVLVSANMLWFCNENDAMKLSNILPRALQMMGPSGCVTTLEICYVEWKRTNVLEDLCKMLLTRMETIKNPNTANGTIRVKRKEDYLCVTQRVLVTPLRVCPQRPDPEVPNRILRQFRDHASRFIRVNFCDENLSPAPIFDDYIEKRVRQIVWNGLIVGGRRFVFLAYSNSQLREQGCWMYDEGVRDGKYPPTAQSIRESIGDVSTINSIGKRGSRLGQAFSSTAFAVHVNDKAVRVVPDIKVGKYCFSDGVGCISPALADKIASVMQLKHTPSAFQIRYRGSKGVLTLDPFKTTDMQKDVLLRPSMIKFNGNTKVFDLEICTVAQFMPCYLNRQIITLLSCLGVPDPAFTRLMQSVVALMDHALEDHGAATKFVSEYALNSEAAVLLEAGLSPNTDRYLRDMIGTLRERLLADIRLKARLPVKKDVTLIGVLDEYDILAENEIFLQTREPGFLIPPPGTPVVVGRNPSLHPGDIRVLNIARRDPRLSHLYDVVVFSARGRRPQMNMMSGGDLDGDIYFVIWDENLLPQPLESRPPMDFSTGGNPRHSVTSTTIRDFFVDYMKNDRLGQIANMHVVFADKYGADCDECLQLAALHSVAVDFAKSGVPAPWPKEMALKIGAYPDFMEKTEKPMYTSQTILGRLYRWTGAKQKELEETKIKTVTEGEEVVPEWKLTKANTNFLVVGYQDYVKEAKSLYDQYLWELWDLSCKFEVFEECELLSGHIKTESRKFSRIRREKNSAAEALNARVSELKSFYKKLFWIEFAKSEDDFDSLPPDVKRKVFKKASAWYYAAYAYQDDSGYAPYLSFAWLARRPMCEIVRFSRLEM